MSNLLSFAPRLAPLFFCVVALVLAGGCTGYRLGSVGGAEIQGVRTIHIPMAINSSYYPNVHVDVTSAVIREFDRDGTLRTAQGSSADSELRIEIKEMDRTPRRNVQGDVQVTAEYSIELVAEITFLNRRLGTQVIKQEAVRGSSTFFVGSDLQEAERQAVPLAAEELARNIVMRIVEGW